MSIPERRSGPEPETFGDPSRIDCPHCGRRNDISDDDVNEGDEHECRHCDRPFYVAGVDHSVTVTVKPGKAKQDDDP